MIRFIIVLFPRWERIPFPHIPHPSIPKERKKTKQPTSNLGEYKLSIRHSQQARSIVPKNREWQDMAKNLCVSQDPYKLTTLASGSFSPASPLLDRTSTDTSTSVPHQAQLLVEKNKNKSLTSGLYGLGYGGRLGSRMIAEDAFCADKQYGRNVRPNKHSLPHPSNLCQVRTVPE